MGWGVSGGEYAFYSSGTKVQCRGNQRPLALPRGTYQLVISGEGLKKMKTDAFTFDESQFVIRDFILEKETGIWGMIKTLLYRLF